MLNCVFCRVSGFPHGVEGQFGLQGGVGVSRRVWGATYSRRWERANSMKLSQCRGGPPGDAARGGRAAWKSVKKRPRKRTPTKSGRYSEGHPRKGPFGGRPKGPSPPPRPPRPPPPRGQEEEDENYIIQHRQFHPDSQSGDNGRQKRRAKRPNYEGDQAKGRAT